MDTDAGCGGAQVRPCRRRVDDLTKVQAGHLAIDRQGNVGASDVQPWFQYAITDAMEGTRLGGAESFV